MATKVIDLDLQRLPAEIRGLESYSKALILIRFRGRPVGRALLPVTQGHLKGQTLRTALMDAAGLNLWTAWLQDTLGDDVRGAKAPPPTATVAVCTRDRPDDLRRCLEALMRLPDRGQEFIVVDNAPSTDETRRLVGAFGRVRYVREDRPGLDCARNRALREARHEVVAFTDDDAVPDPGWLQALLQNFEDPLVLCVTGLTMPLELETSAQECFEQLGGFSRGFTRKVFDAASLHPLVAGPVGAGVNMALRREVIERVGFFDEALDAGTPTHSGGDHELFSRIMTAGYRIVYEPAALNWHRHRRTWEDLRQTIYGYGTGVYAAWTRSLLREKEFAVFKVAWRWLRHQQVPALLRSAFRRPNSPPLGLVWAELRGCMAGPGAYLRSRRLLRTRSNRRA